MTATPAPPSLELAVPDGWPAPPDPAAHHGLAGAIVGKLAPNTEADPVAILTHLLVACGAMIGHDAFLQVEATRHHPNEFVLLVGDAAKARIWCAHHILAYFVHHPASPPTTSPPSPTTMSVNSLIDALEAPWR
jgi:hypothetical protein